MPKDNVVIIKKGYVDKGEFTNQEKDELIANIKRTIGERIIKDIMINGRAMVDIEIVKGQRPEGWTTKTYVATLEFPRAEE